MNMLILTINKTTMATVPTALFPKASPQKTTVSGTNISRGTDAISVTPPPQAEYPCRSGFGSL